MITFTPLSEPYDRAEGSSSKEKAKALAYLAEVDDVRILVDCGSPESFEFKGDGGLDDVLKEIAPTIDLVLLCHSTLPHLGLYAYARAKFGLVAPCYSTLPTATMGRLSVLEGVLQIRSERLISDDDEKGHSCIATAEQVDAAFEHISTLRYLQPTQLEGKCAGLTLTAYSAGHTLGGAVWKLRSPSSGTLLIALDWNHNRERHIDGTALITTSVNNAPTPSGPNSTGGGIADAIRRPDVLITSMSRAFYTNSRRKDRDAALLDVIHHTIRGGHSVLIPVDASARLLEILVLLDQHWAFAYPHVRFPLCLVSTTGKEVVERARTLMEWMTREWARSSDAQAAAAAAAANNEEGTESAPPSKRPRSNRNNASHAPASPLDFQYLRIFSSLSAMDEALSPSAAKVVLAWPPSLTHGPSRKLFTRMSANEQDVVILTQRGESGTLGRELYDKWEGKQNTAARWGQGKVGKVVSIKESMQVEVYSKVPLQGEELEAFLETQRIANERAAQQKALLARSTRRLEADEDDEASDFGSSDEDSDQEDQVVENGEGEDARKVTKKRGSAIDNLNEEDEMSFNPEISFDIYLKGKASRAMTFFGTTGERASGRYKTGVRFRTFPVVERKRKVDTYGETLDIAKWLSRKRQLEALGGEEVEGQSRVQEEARKRQEKERDEKEKKKKEEPPSKFVTETLSVNLSCRLDFVDMEGLGDGRALKTIVPQLEPRRVILVESCSAEERESLKSSLSVVRGMTPDIRLPVQSDKIEIGEFTSNYTVNLGEDVLGHVRFSNFQDYQVALLQAKINYRAESSIAMLEALDMIPESSDKLADEAQQDGDSKEKVNLEQAAPTTPANTSTEGERAADGVEDNTTTVAVKQPTTLFIGDLKLSSLKQSLAKVSKPSIPSEFIGEGTLVCGAGAFSGGVNTASQEDVVTVRKENEGEIIIEGNISKNFYNVRDAVYALHAQVTG